MSREFEDALNEMEKGQDHLFITGRAGTGKSTLLQLFKSTTNKKGVVLAPTGVAALNVQGQTIHSFFSFPPHFKIGDHISKRRNRKLFRALEFIIIDEISMVRADLLDHIDRFLQLNRENSNAFGGVKMIFFGDMFQLPPVVATQEEKIYLSKHYSSPYFFSSDVFARLSNFQFIELRTVYRQESKYFIRLLDQVRTNTLDLEGLEELNGRAISALGTIEASGITLCARNATANQINSRKLNGIDQISFSYMASVVGKFPEHRFPTDAILELKEGAQVMFIKNDVDKQFVNGTLGSIVELSTKKIIVQLAEGDEGKRIEVTPVSWDIIRYKWLEKEQKIDMEVTGSFKQLPLKLAWAITIHKSQGKTFDRITVDLGSGAFESGQTYVALSRCRTLEGIFLKQKLKPRDIFIDPEILEFYDTYR